MIQCDKNGLRRELRGLRVQMNGLQKKDWDTKIFHRARDFIAHTQESCIFLYVSSNIEVDTIQIIHYSLSIGKSVAVPLCKNASGDMDFYFIHSLDDLVSGRFGISEPNPIRCECVTDYSRGICFVPGLGFNEDGKRIGFGKGYYDRFLVRFGGMSVGLCYDNCLHPNIPTDVYDQAVDAVITQSRLILCKKNDCL